jgi:hypothetical protein
MPANMRGMVWEGRGEGAGTLRAGVGVMGRAGCLTATGGALWAGVGVIGRAGSGARVTASTGGIGR